MAQYIHDNTQDEVSHFTFLNAYLMARGGRPVNLDRFRTLPSSTATGAQQIRVTDPEVLRVLLSIRPTETMHFQTWSDKAGNAPPLNGPINGLVFPDLDAPPFGGEEFQVNLIMPQPTVFLSRAFPRVSIVRPTATEGRPRAHSSFSSMTGSSAGSPPGSSPS